MVSVTGLRYQIRDPGVSYLVDFGSKDDDQGLKTGIVAETIMLRVQSDNLGGRNGKAQWAHLREKGAGCR